MTEAEDWTGAKWADTDKSANVEALIEKAAKAEKSEDAMRFSQAATNSANALLCLESLKRKA